MSADQNEMSVEDELALIESYAKKVKERPDGPQALVLAWCVDFMFRYMVRNQHEDAPLFGPEADEYESQGTKMDRLAATAAIGKLVKGGILKDVSAAAQVDVKALKEALDNAYLGL